MTAFLQNLNLLSYSSLLKTKGPNWIFDPCRKKYVHFSPEETVRQLLIIFLHKEFGIPFALMAVEKALTINGKSYRYDMAVFNRKGKMHLLVECKSPEEKFADAHLSQSTKYNLALQAPFILVTNGLHGVLTKVHAKDQKVEILSNLSECFMENLYFDEPLNREEE